MGRAIAESLASEGCNLCLVARTKETLEKAASDIRSTYGVEVLAIAGDVSDPALAKRVISEAASKFGSVHILINNAGGPPPGSFTQHSDETWMQAFQQNFFSVLRFSREVAPLMKAQKWGRIVNITSSIAKEPTAIMVLSGSARAAVSALTKSISSELAQFNITVNTLCPGGVDTERAANLMKIAAESEGKTLEEIYKRSAAAIPIQRLANPKEIADTVAFIASDKASYLTGLSIMIDGGLTKSIF